MAPLILILFPEVSDCAHAPVALLTGIEPPVPFKFDGFGRKGGGSARSDRPLWTTEISLAFVGKVTMIRFLSSPQCNYCVHYTTSPKRTKPHNKIKWSLILRILDINPETSVKLWIKLTWKMKNALLCTRKSLVPRDLRYRNLTLWSTVYAAYKLSIFLTENARPVYSKDHTKCIVVCIIIST